MALLSHFKATTKQMKWEAKRASISTIKATGASLILGPIVATVCYFIQHLIVFSDVEYGSAALWATLAAENASLIVITSIIIPLSLMMLICRILFVSNEIRGSGNGDALDSYSVPLVTIGFIEIVLSRKLSPLYPTQPYT